VLQTALATLNTAAEAVDLSGPISAITRPLLAPHRAVLVGRVGVGKTTLANRWCGTTHPTGLGGVTEAATSCDAGSTLVFDTPGIDRPEQAILDLGPLVAGADSLVWVLDGLQPLTASERHVVDAIRPATTPVHILLSRADLLDPDDVEQVLHRVHALTGLSAVALDLRHDTLPVLPTGPSASRRGAAELALLALTAALPPARLTAQQAQRTLRERIQALVEQLRTEVHAGSLGHKVDALAALHERGPSALVGLPPLPAPARPDQDRVSRLLGGLSGIEGAERLLKAGAASWLAEAQLALVDSYEAHPEWEQLALDRQRFNQAVQDAVVALRTETEPPPSPSATPPGPRSP
jgi:signal recognition particle receptor subunit beta